MAGHPAATNDFDGRSRWDNYTDNYLTHRKGGNFHPAGYFDDSVDPHQAKSGEAQ
ncbi:hypothetical protein GCM10027615_21570 [Plantactinospora veratri]